MNFKGTEPRGALAHQRLTRQSAAPPEERAPVSTTKYDRERHFELATRSERVVVSYSSLCIHDYKEKDRMSESSPMPRAKRHLLPAIGLVKEEDAAPRWNKNRLCPVLWNRHKGVDKRRAKPPREPLDTAQR